MILNSLIIFLLSIQILGCNPPSILVSQARPLPQIRSIAIIPFYGNVTDCAQEAHHVLESTLYSYFTQRGIMVVPVDPEVSEALPDIIDVTGILSRDKAQQIGELFDVDAFISGSVSECHYFNPKAGDGFVFLTVKIYNGRTGELLLHIDGKKTIEYTDTHSINLVTSEIIKAMFDMLGWK